jgi:TnpA family transposase
MRSKTLFGEGDRNVINWRLIEKMWPDLMRVAISIREGRLNSVTMRRRLTSNSRRNEIYRAFLEVGRSVRTVALLRYLADPALRRPRTRSRPTDSPAGCGSATPA